MKLLLLGCNGQLGWELQRALAPLGEVVTAARSGAMEAADFSNPAMLDALVRRVSPDVVVNAAAYTAVDKAESEPALAHAVNAEAVGMLAHAANACNALLVHYSTDYVFDGSGHTPRTELDPVAPLSVYGSTKLEGERLIAASGCRYLVFRTSWVYAARGGNFARTMLRLATEREQLAVIDDQIGAPTGADLLADTSAHAIRTALHRPDALGLYNLVAAGETSWHGYACHVIEWARRHGQAIKVPADRVLPIPTSAYPTPAQRPLNSRLSTRKLQDTFGLAPPVWQGGVDRMLTEIFNR